MIGGRRRAASSHSSRRSSRWAKLARSRARRRTWIESRSAVPVAPLDDLELGASHAAADSSAWRAAPSADPRRRARWRARARRCGEQDARRRIAARERPLRVARSAASAAPSRQPALRLAQRIGRQDEGGHDERRGRAERGLPDALERVGVGVRGATTSSRAEIAICVLSSGPVRRTARSGARPRAGTRRRRSRSPKSATTTMPSSTPTITPSMRPSESESAAYALVADGHQRHERREDRAIGAQQAREPPREPGGDRDANRPR